MKHYWCVNCGYAGDFKFYRQRNVNCEKCGYDEPMEVDEQEWNEEGYKEKHEAQQKDEYYQKRVTKWQSK